MKYFKRYHGKEERLEISEEEALDTLLTTYRDNDMTRDMLTIPNNIFCRYSTVYVEDDSDPRFTMVLMSGLCNELPMGVEYDDDGNRV